MSARLPKWIEAGRTAMSSSHEAKIARALAIAWESLRLIGHAEEYFKSKECPMPPDCQNCEANDAMKRIEKLGGGE